jgi:hypothetical protein
LALAQKQRGDAVLLRVTAAEVVRTKDRDVPPLATILREVLSAWGGKASAARAREAGF